MENGDGTVAEITMKTVTKQVAKADFRGNTVRFKCQRCAVFCCKLGGPKLSTSDVERLKQGGCDPDIFLNFEQTNLRNTESGSCIFLSFNAEAGLYQCSVYAFRPTACRLYPFYFEKLDTRFYALRFIPCCNGLNAEDGEIVDAKFFVEFLQSALLDLTESSAV